VSPWEVLSIAYVEIVRVLCASEPKGAPRQIRDGIILGSAEGAPDRAVDGRADEIIGVVGRALRSLRRSSTENFLYVKRRSFQHDVGGGKGADVATGAGERHPRSRHVLAGRRGKRKGVVCGRRSDTS